MSTSDRRLYINALSLLQDTCPVSAEVTGIMTQSLPPREKAIECLKYVAQHNPDPACISRHLSRREIPENLINEIFK